MSEETLVQRPTPSRRKSSRNTEMCEKCRHDRKKCTPADRDWANGRVRCDRCIELDPTGLYHPCGSPVKSNHQYRKSVLNLNSPTQNAGEWSTPSVITSQPTGNGMFHDPDLMKGGCSSLLSVPDQPLQGRTRSRTVRSRSQDARIRIGMPAALNSHRFARSGRDVLQKLEDLLALRRMLQRDHPSIRVRRELVGASGDIKAAEQRLDNWIEQVNRKILHHLREVTRVMKEDDGFSKESFQSRLTMFMQKFNRGDLDLSNTPVNASDTTNNIKQIFVNFEAIQYTFLQQYGHFSDAEFVTCGVSMHFLDSRTNVGVRDLFERAAFGLQQAWDSLDFAEETDEDYVSTCSSNTRTGRRCQVYTAAQLAYRTGHKDFAYRWWKEEPASLLETDVLGRNAIHYAVEDGDNRNFEIFNRGGSNHNEILKCQAMDTLGHSPLCVAALLNRLKIFVHLLRYIPSACPSDAEGRSVLALAARAGSILIVSYIMQHGLFLGTVHEALTQAIEGCRDDIASFLVQSCRQSFQMEAADTLQGKLDQARLLGMMQTVKEIEDVQRANFFASVPERAVFGLNSAINPDLSPGMPLDDDTSYNETESVEGVVPSNLPDDFPETSEGFEDYGGCSTSWQLWSTMGIPSEHTPYEQQW